jgi:Zn-dependent protease
MPAVRRLPQEEARDVMLRAWNVGSAFGIKVYLHWTTLILLPLWVLTMTSGTEEGPLFYLAVTAVIFSCVVLHEFGHALAARCFGIGTRDITMYPIGGVARLERMSEKPWEELCIALAGPAVNVVIAVLLAVVLVSLFAVNWAVFLESLAGRFIGIVLVSNVVLGLFNLVPAFPMDGGRVLRAFLASFLGQLRATRIAAAVAAVLAVFMGLLGLGVITIHPFFHGFNPLLVFVAGFVFLMGQRELQMVELRERARLEEPLEVLPVRRPQPADMPFVLQPAITVYTWDSVNGIWVRDEGRPAHRFPIDRMP